jgi:hypothetical protein
MNPMNNKLTPFGTFHYGLGEEEEIEEVHMSQNVVTTRVQVKLTSLIPSPSDPPKTTSHTQKTTDKAPKQNTPFVPQSKLEYDFLEDLKRTKENISLFELMKLPQIQENFIKTLQGNTSQEYQRINVGTKRGQIKLDHLWINNTQKTIKL